MDEELQVYFKNREFCKVMSTLCGTKQKLDSARNVQFC